MPTFEATPVFAAATAPLSTAVLAGETVADLIGSVVQVERMIAQLQGLRAEIIEQARQVSALSATTPRGVGEVSMAKRSFVSEVACAMRISDRAAETLIGQSQAIVADLPLTRAALRSGAMSYTQAQSMVDHCAGLPPEQRSAVEVATVHRAPSTTKSQFERRVRIARESLAPESSIERAKRAVERRTVDLSPERDGMAWISALLPAVDALAIFDRLMGAAKSFQNDGDARTLPQLRADILRSCLLDDDAIVLAGHPMVGDSGEIRRFRGIRPQVLITVPVMTLLGHRTDDIGDDSGAEPAILDGYGPIDPETARQLTSEAPSLSRILTDPETGAVRSVGRDRYRIPAELRLWLRIRDGHCRFPGCGRSTAYSDVDHTVDWQFGGATDHDNLAHLCSSHHTLKHSSEWSVEQGDNGELHWRSPAGFSYTTHPDLDLAA